MKEFIIKFIYFVYVNYIYEDLSIYKKWAYGFIYINWFIKSILIWLISPIFIFEFYFVQSKVYKQFKKLKNAEI